MTYKIATSRCIEYCTYCLIFQHSLRIHFKFNTISTRLQGRVLISSMWGYPRSMPRFSIKIFLNWGNLSRMFRFQRWTRKEIR